MKRLKALSIDEMRVLKIIRVVGPDWNYFTGYLPYLRTLRKEYDINNGDYLDEHFIKTVKAAYPSSSLVESALLLFEGELEDRLNAIRGACTKDYSINFFPYINCPYEKLYELQSRIFTNYPTKFSLRLHIENNSDKIKHIHEYELCYIDYTKIDDIIKTIFPI